LYERMISYLDGAEGYTYLSKKSSEAEVRGQTGNNRGMFGLWKRSRTYF